MNLIKCFSFGWIVIIIIIKLSAKASSLIASIKVIIKHFKAQIINYFITVLKNEYYINLCYLDQYSPKDSTKLNLFVRITISIYQETIIKANFKLKMYCWMEIINFMVINFM